MNKMSEGFVNAVKSGKISVNLRPDSNFPEEMVMEFSYANADPYTFELREKADGLMPEVWECVEYSGTDGCLLHRTNGFATQFVSVNPDCTRGAYRMGKVKTTKGVVNIEGGWSSRPSVVYKYTGIRLIEISIDNGLQYINWEVASALAEYLNLVIDKSLYTSSSDGEEGWAMYKKDVARCPECNAVVSARIGHRCERCGCGYDN